VTGHIVSSACILDSPGSLKKHTFKRYGEFNKFRKESRLLEERHNTQVCNRFFSRAKEYVSGVKSASLYDTGIDAEYGDELIVLSTCNYHTDNGRFVVVAKRIK